MSEASPKTKSFFTRLGYVLPAEVTLVGGLPPKPKTMVIFRLVALLAALSRSRAPPFLLAILSPCCPIRRKVSCGHTVYFPVLFGGSLCYERLFPDPGVMSFLVAPERPSKGVRLALTDRDVPLRRRAVRALSLSEDQFSGASFPPLSFFLRLLPAGMSRCYTFT